MRNLPTALEETDDGPGYSSTEDSTFTNIRNSQTKNPKTHKMTNIAGETKATMINYTDEDEDEMFCTPVYCLETLLPMRESRGTLSSSVIWFG